MVTDVANAISRFFYRQSAGMFALRLVTGTVFIVHGATKLGSVEAMTGFFGSIGLTPAFIWIWAIGLLEVVGGAALIFGIATRFFGAAFAIEMVVAIFLTGLGRGFHAHEYELLLAAASLAIALTGSGRWSLYQMECENCGGMFCSGDTCVLVA